MARTPSPWTKPPETWPRRRGSRVRFWVRVSFLSTSRDASRLLFYSSKTPSARAIQKVTGNWRRWGASASGQSGVPRSHDHTFRLSISTRRASGHNWQRRCRARTVRVDLIVPHVISRRSCSRTRPLSSRHSVCRSPAKRAQPTAHVGALWNADERRSVLSVRRTPSRRRGRWQQ